MALLDGNQGTCAGGAWTEYHVQAWIRHGLCLWLLNVTSEIRFDLFCSPTFLAELGFINGWFYLDLLSSPCYAEAQTGSLLACGRRALTDRCADALCMCLQMSARPCMLNEDRY